MNEDNIPLMTVDLLRKHCKNMGLESKGNRAELMERLIKELQEIKEWEAKKANPTIYEQGHRIILDNGTEIALHTRAYFPDHGRFRRSWVLVEYINPEFPDDPKDYVTGSTVEKALASARTNIGANHLIKEYLRPGQKSRVELGIL